MDYTDSFAKKSAGSFSRLTAPNEVIRKALICTRINVPSILVPSGIYRFASLIPWEWSQLLFKPLLT